MCVNQFDGGLSQSVSITVKGFNNFDKHFSQTKFEGVRLTITRTYFFCT